MQQTDLWPLCSHAEEFPSSPALVSVKPHYLGHFSNSLIRTRTWKDSLEEVYSMPRILVTFLTSQPGGPFGHSFVLHFFSLRYEWCRL